MAGVRGDEVGWMTSRRWSGARRDRVGPYDGDDRWSWRSAKGYPRMGDRGRVNRPIVVVASSTAASWWPQAAAASWPHRPSAAQTWMAMGTWDAAESGETSRGPVGDRLRQSGDHRGRATWADDGDADDQSGQWAATGPRAGSSPPPGTRSEARIDVLRDEIDRPRPARATAGFQETHRRCDRPARYSAFWP